MQRAASRVEKSLRNEILPRGSRCGTHDHFLERVRILYKDRFPINRGGLTISITRDDALQDVLAKAVELTLDTYLARHRDDADNDQLRAGAFAVEFTGDVLAEVGNVNFKQLKYDVIATGWRQPGSTFKIFTYGSLVERLTNEVLAAEPQPASVDAIVAEVLERCTVLDAPIFVPLGRGRGVKKIENFHSRSEPQYRGDMNCRLAMGESRNTAAMRAGARAGIKNVIELTYRLGMPRDSKHPLQPYPTTAIGASEVNPLSMASTAAFLNGGFRVTPRFVNDICRDGKSLLHTDDEGLAKECDIKGENRPATRAAHASRRIGGDDRAFEESARHGPNRHGVCLEDRRDPGNGSVERGDLEVDRRTKGRSERSRFRSTRRARSRGRPAPRRTRTGRRPTCGCCCSFPVRPSIRRRASCSASGWARTRRIVRSAIEARPAAPGSPSRALATGCIRRRRCSRFCRRSGDFSGPDTRFSRSSAAKYPALSRRKGRGQSPRE